MTGWAGGVGMIVVLRNGVTPLAGATWLQAVIIGLVIVLAVAAETFLRAAR